MPKAHEQARGFPRSDDLKGLSEVPLLVDVFTELHMSWVRSRVLRIVNLELEDGH